MRGGRGGSRDNFRGGNRGNKFQGNGGRGNDRSRYDDGNGIQTVECGLYDGMCEGNPIFKLNTRDKSVPFTGTFIYDSKKNKIGTVKDVFGPLDKVYFSMEVNSPSVTSSLKEGSKVYAPADRLKSEEFFLSDQNSRRGGRGGKRGGGGPRGRRGGGGQRGGGRGGNRGGGRDSGRGGNRGRRF